MLSFTPTWFFEEMRRLWFPEGAFVEGKDTEMQECKGHYHPSEEHLRIILSAFGVFEDESSWNNPRFVRNELDILGQYAMRISVYIRQEDGELHRETMVCGPRRESQIEESPGNYKRITGRLHDRERMSGDLEGATIVEIVAVQLDRGEIICLDQSLCSAIIVPALHGHTPFSYEDGIRKPVAFGEKTLEIEFKFSETRDGKRIIHPHSETYAVLAATMEDARYAQEDREFAAALGPLF